MYTWTSSGFGEYLCRLNQGAGLIPEPAVHLQEPFRFGFRKAITAECNNDDNLTSRVDASRSKDTLYTVGGNEVLRGNDFSALMICRFGSVANKEQSSGRIHGLYDNFRIMAVHPCHGHTKFF